MTKRQKLIERFLDAPETVAYREIERTLRWFGCDKLAGKGSHIKFVYGNESLVIPVHHKECKAFYKKQAREFLLRITQPYEITNQISSDDTE